MKPIQTTVGLLTILFVLVQMLIGSSFIDSVVLALILALNVISGSIVWTLIFKKNVHKLTELIGVGIALGTLIPAVISMISAILGIHAPYLTLIFPGLVLALFLSNATYRHVNCLQPYDHEISESYFLYILPAGGLLAWGFDLGGFVVFSISAIALHKFVLRRIKLHPLFEYVVITLGLFITFALSLEVVQFKSIPIWQKFTGVDTVIDEAMSFGVVHFGINDSMLNVGNPIRLHVLSHSWAGDLSRISNADTYIVSGAVGYFVGLLGISFLLHSIGFLISGKRIVGVIASALFFFQASMPEELVSLPAPRMANSISMLWFLYSVYFLMRCVEKNRNLVFFCYPVFVSLVTMAKAQWGLLLLVTTSPLVIMEFRKSKAGSFISLSFGCMAFLMTYLFLIGGAANDHATNPNRIIQLTLVQGCSLIAFTILRTPIIHILMRRETRTRDSFRRIFLVGVVCLPAIFIFNGGYLTTYLYYPVFLLSTPILATIVVGKIDSSDRQGGILFFIFLGIVFGAVGFFVYLYANYRFIDSNRADFLSFVVVDFPMLIPLMALIALVFLSHLFYKNHRFDEERKRSWDSQISFITVLAVAINFGVFIVQSNRQDILNHFYELNSEVDLPVSDSMLEVGQWINENTESFSIIATNYFCSNSDPTESLILLPKSGDCRTRNELAWVSATSKRRMLIEAPLFVAGKEMSSDEANRYSTSLEFGLTGSIAAYNDLQKYRVDYFVLDRRHSINENWNESAEIVFSSGDFLILKL